MNYVDWVEHVGRALAVLTAPSGWVVTPDRILSGANVTGQPKMAVLDAIADLVDIGVADDWTNQNFIRDSQNLRAVRQGAPLSTLWPSIVTPWLDDEQLAFLDRLVSVCEQPEEDFCTVRWTTAESVFVDLGWAIIGDEPLTLAQSLERLRYVQTRVSLESPALVRPSYRGIVKATKAVATEWQRRLPSMVEEWETATVEFKRELHFGSPSRNAEFAHDVIALANTKASGAERYLVVGYDPKTRAFSTSVSSSISQERIEDVLNQYADTAPRVRYFTVTNPSGPGTVGILEVTRDPAEVPHRLRRGGGKRHPGDVYVRHGSHIEIPTADELDALQAEGQSARLLRDELAPPRL